MTACRKTCRWKGNCYSQRLWPGVWVCVRNLCTGAGWVNALLDIPLPSKCCTEMSVTIPKDRGEQCGAAAPARDRFLSPSQGFYTWFNMLPVEFGSILHSGLLRHSHFKSNCWPGHIPAEEKAVDPKDTFLAFYHQLFFKQENAYWSSATHYRKEEYVRSPTFIAEWEINTALLSMCCSIPAFNQNYSNEDLLQRHMLIHFCMLMLRFSLLNWKHAHLKSLWSHCISEL